MKKNIFICLVWLFLLMPFNVLAETTTDNNATENTKTYDEYICMFGYSAVSEDVMLIYQDTTGNKKIYSNLIRSGVSQDEIREKAYGCRKDGTCGELFKEFENDDVSYNSADAVYKFTGEKKDKYDGQNGNYYINLPVSYTDSGDAYGDFRSDKRFIELKNSEWDLKDYCNNDSIIYRYYGMKEGWVVDSLFDTFFAANHEDYYVIINNNIDFHVRDESGQDMMGAIGFLSYFFVYGESAVENKFEGAVEFNKYDYNYEEAIKKINETEWSLECIYTGVNMYIDHFNKELFMFSLNNKETITSSAFNYDNVSEVGSCPQSLYYSKLGNEYTFYLPDNLNGDYDEKMPLIGAENIKDKINSGKQDCESLLGNPKCESGQNCSPAFYLQTIFNIMKYIAIILVIVFTTIDFIVAVSAQDDDKMKKATNKAAIRLIWCVAIFILPILLEFLFTFIDVYSPSTCGLN